MRERYVLFFKRKTAYEMRISDWSSDVCSSDLRALCADRPVLRKLAEEDVGRIAAHERRSLVGIGADPVADHLEGHVFPGDQSALDQVAADGVVGLASSEERRVGKECGRTCRSRWSPSH